MIQKLRQGKIVFYLLHQKNETWISPEKIADVAVFEAVTYLHS
jgi:hypothetical protein